jgi:hypothetical protein
MLSLNERRKRALPQPKSGWLKISFRNKWPRHSSKRLSVRKKKNRRRLL